MVDREVHGPVWVVFCRSWGLCVRSWAALGAYVVGLGTVLGPMLAILGLYGRSRAALGAFVRSLGCIWAALGAYVGGLGPLLGAMLAVLGRSWSRCLRSWGLCWRSWAALGAYVGGLGRSWGLRWRPLAALGRKVAQTRTGPGPKAEKWPKPEREQGAAPRTEAEPSEWPGASTHFFYRYAVSLFGS